jgi:hypothetical protein
LFVIRQAMAITTPAAYRSHIGVQHRRRARDNCMTFVRRR